MASMATLNNQRVVFKKRFYPHEDSEYPILSMILNIPYDSSCENSDGDWSEYHDDFMGF